MCNRPIPRSRDQPRANLRRGKGSRMRRVRPSAESHDCGRADNRDGRVARRQSVLGVRPEVRPGTSRYNRPGAPVSEASHFFHSRPRDLTSSCRTRFTGSSRSRLKRRWPALAPGSTAMPSACANMTRRTSAGGAPPRRASGAAATRGSSRTRRFRAARRTAPTRPPSLPGFPRCACGFTVSIGSAQWPTPSSAWARPRWRAPNWESASSVWRWTLGTAGGDRPPARRPERCGFPVTDPLCLSASLPPCAEDMYPAAWTSGSSRSSAP